MVARESQSPVNYLKDPFIGAGTFSNAVNAELEAAPLRRHVVSSVRQLLADIDVTVVDNPNLYEVVLREMEIPLFTEVLAHVDGNQSKAADILGIHRATLRKKLRLYGLS